jgi:DNA-binding PadR family transcriptional regulator
MDGRRSHGRFGPHSSGRHGGFHGRMRGGGLRIGRMLSAADLYLIILALLEDRPRHGYDLIKAIQELTGGAYVPSPGMVYPALSYLEELGQVAVQADGVKKQYRLTESGLTALNENRATVSSLLNALKRVGERLGQAQEAYARSDLDPVVAKPGSPVSLETVRRDLKSALFDSLDASVEEQQRIAAILQRTIAEIRNK